MGRPRKLTDQQREEIVDMVVKDRHTAADAARLSRVSPTTVSRTLAEARAGKTDPIRRALAPAT